MTDELSKLRNGPDSGLSADQRRRLLEDSKIRAAKAVPSPDLREAICREAKALGAKPRTPLSKEALARLDLKYLIGEQKRLPDPKYVRWVLRARNLHPQGQVYGSTRKN